MASTRLLGISLVVLGVLLLVVLQAGVGGEAIPLFIGAGFMVAYTTTRQYGFLVPGGILTGLGAGIVADSAADLEGATVLGLGLGFLLIAVVDVMVRGRTDGFWWPVIPGGILSIVGLATMPATEGLAAYLVPAALIVAGAVLILGRGLPGAGRSDAGRTASPDETDEPGDRG